MPNSNFLQYHLFIAGQKVKIKTVTISTFINSLAICRIDLDYSPHIIHLPKYTQLAVFSSLNNNEPVLEFDAVLVGINYNKSIMAGHYVTLSCFTQGIIWNARRQIDITLDEMAGLVRQGSTDTTYTGIGGGIDSTYTNSIKSNAYDVGAAGTCILTSHFTYNINSKNNDGTPNKAPTSYSFIYNGKSLISNFNNAPDIDAAGFTNPKFYLRFLDTFKLKNKLYGLTTTNTLKSYFDYQGFFDILSNNYTDIHGENTFWQLAANTWMIGYHEVLDIPNPTFIPYDQNFNNTNTSINISTFNLGTEDSEKTINVFNSDSSSRAIKINNGKNQYAGLAEYVIKPRSIFGIPFKCNIIWPDQILEFSILKDFFNEITRVRSIRNSIPSVDNPGNEAFSTTVVLGPNFEDKTDYFNSFNAPNIDPNDIERIRTEQDFSNYELEFGTVNGDLQLQEAYNAVLYRNSDSQSVSNEANSRLKSYINYEFAQRYFKNRKCSITVNNEVDVLVGLPVIILNESGQHLIAYCLSKTKTWDAAGSSSTQLEIGYPRYTSELIGSLAEIIDPLSYESSVNNSELSSSISELEKILGTQRIDIKPFNATSNPNPIENAINDIFINYNLYKKNGIDILKNQYRRKVCTYTEYCNFYSDQPLQFKSGQYTKSESISINQNMNSTLQTLFDSTAGMNDLSCNLYTVYDTINNTLETISGKSVNEIVNLHIAFTNNTANRV